MSKKDEHKNLSAFGEASLKLDRAFSEMERLGGQLERLDIENESDYERSKSVLGAYGESASQAAQLIQEMARGLEESKNRSETTARSVAAIADRIQARHHQATGLMARFQELSESVRGMNQQFSDLRKSTDDSGSVKPEAKEKLLREVDGQLAHWSEKVHHFKLDARQAKLKTLEKNADSLEQTMIAARRKLTGFLPKNHH